MSILRRQPRIGEVYMMRFGGDGSEQNGWRPGLVLQNNTGNIHSPNIIALPLTSAIKKQYLPTHVLIPAKGTGLKMDSMVLCENPERMSKSKIGNYITTIPPNIMSKVAEAYLLATSVIAYIDPNNLIVIWQRAVSLNATL